MSAPVRLPLTDPFSHILTHQGYESVCKDFEMRYYKCMEAYGIPGGNTKCKDFYDDFTECFTRRKTQLRMQAMIDERKRQVKAGERPKDKQYVPTPPVGSYPIGAENKFY